MSSAWIGLVVGVVICGASVWLGYSGYEEDFRFKDAEEWPETVGTVTESTVTGGEFSIVKMRYTYNVGGQAYFAGRHGFRSFPTFAADEKDQAEAARRAQFSVGQEVVVYYNPDRPEDALLDPSSVAKESSLVDSLAIPVAGFALGIFVLLMYGNALKAESQLTARRSVKPDSLSSIEE
ncbi:MAG: DUF3592 domain-containing protein [Planctomycetales bacterium]|nr:DUF3592 domain-containing protein [Planctomycetales bacterium]